MTSGLWQQLDLLGRRAVPFALTLALIVLGVLPWPLPGATPVAPLPALAAVYYWSVHRPELMPPAGVFALGLAQDMLGGGPPGLSALVLLLAQGLTLRWRRHFVRAPFILAWWGFVMAAAGAGAVSWLIASIYYATPVWSEPLLVQFALNVCLYPVLSWVFGWTRIGATEARPR
jgi:rod shape-determining protein MreD